MYASSYGRFNTPDRYQASASGANDPTTPQTWNRYAYVLGDPVNHTDRRGMYLDADECIDNPDACVAEDQSGGAATTPGSPCYGNYFVATGQESCPDWSDDPQQAGAGCGITRGQYYSYDCLTQSGGQWNQFESSLNSVKSLLINDPKCEKFLASTVGIQDFTLDVANLSSFFAVANSFSLNVTGANAPGTSATTYDVSGFTTIINFQTFQQETPSQQRDTILHEMAHWLDAKGFSQSDLGSSGGQSHNEKLLKKNCSKTIKGN